jgi:hypothetical protein
VDAADHQGAVDVAFHKVDQHFVAHARGEVAAPVGAGQPFGNAYPGAISPKPTQLVCRPW